MRMISDWKNDLIPPEQAHTTCETAEDVQFAHLYQLYERNLRAYNAVDFDDLDCNADPFITRKCRSPG